MTWRAKVVFDDFSESSIYEGIDYPSEADHAWSRITEGMSNRDIKRIIQFIIYKDPL